MELTDGGWYKTPRIIKGEDFLAHIHDTYASGNAILDVTVSGVPMKLIRVQEIAKGVLFFVFQDEEKNKRYYYNRPAIKLRIVTDSETGEQKYLLDHIKAMYID